MVEKGLGEKALVNSIIHDVTDWTENKYNTSGSPIYQEVKAIRQ